MQISYTPSLKLLALASRIEFRAKKTSRDSSMLSGFISSGRAFTDPDYPFVLLFFFSYFINFMPIHLQNVMCLYEFARVYVCVCVPLILFSPVVSFLK